MTTLFPKRRSLLLLLAGALVLLPVLSQAQQYSNTPIKTILKEITAKTGYHFVYSDALKAVDEKVSFRLDGKLDPITPVLNRLFEGRGISFKIEGKQILLTPSSIAPGNSRQAPRTVTVRGRVTDPEGEPVVGAAVQNLTDNTYAITDANGNYSLAVKDPRNATLSVSSLGMDPITESLNGRTTFDVQMTFSRVFLEGSVATGYQTISRERSAASFDIISDVEFKSSALSRGSILEGLEGLAPGFSVNTSSDAESKYLVRGLTSINSSREPLFVVDGVPMSGEDLEAMVSANDISSVTILKDATAVSIWGSRAANGVVVVVTKRGGDTKGKLHVAYDNTFTLKDKPDISYYNLMDSKTFIKNVKEAFQMAGYQDAYDWWTVTNSTQGLSYKTFNQPVVFPHEQILYDWSNGVISESEMNERLDKLAAQDGLQSYSDEFLSRSFHQSHTLSVSGGTDRFSIFGSLAYEGGKGSYNDRDNDFKINVRQDFQITPWLKWDLNLNGAFQRSSAYVLPFSGYSGMASAMMEVLPYASFRNADGTLADFSDYYMYGPSREYITALTGINTNWSPVEDYYNSFNNTKSTRLRVNTGLTADIIDGLRYEGRFQYLSAASNTETYLPENSFAVRSARINALDPMGGESLPRHGGDYTALNSFNADWTLRNQFSYDKGFLDEDHHLTALLGLEFRQDKVDSWNTFMHGYDYQTMAATPYDITAARDIMYNMFGNFISLDVDRTRTSEIVLRYTSYYGNLAYSLFGKYNINGSVRIDQSNLFGTDVNDQFKPIGSVGLSWNINKEPFLKDASWLDLLTLRASYGFSGNSPNPDSGGPYDILTASNDDSLQGESGYDLTSPANTKLTWEKTRTYNIGLDFAFLSHRISGSFDLYDKLTTDLLGLKPVNLMTGYTAVYANVGSLSNKGVELSLTTHNVRGRDFNWFSSLNVAYNKNKVLDYYLSPSDAIYDALSRHYVPGYEAGALFALKWAGLREEDGAPQVYNSAGEKTLEYYSLSAADVDYYGSVIPKWTGSFINRFQYKGFELRAMFIFNLGHKMITSPSLQLGGRFNFNRSMEYDQRWRNPGDEMLTDVPSAYYDPYYMTDRAFFYSDDFYTTSSAVIESASYAKLRELSLSYTFPSAIAARINASSISLRATAHDLFGIYANSKGIDPEAFSLYNGMRGDRVGPYCSFGLSINF